MGMEAAVIGSSLISGGMGMASANKAAKMAGRAPTARSYLGEMSSALIAQEAIMPRLLGLQRQFNPQFQSLQRDTLMGQIGTLQDIYGTAIPTAARLSQQSVQAMSPVLAGIGQQAMSSYQGMLGQGADLLSTMQRQAADELALGRSLSPQETMMGQQAARAAATARGMGLGNQAIATEVLNDYNLANAREMQRRAYAGQVYGLSEGTAMNAYNMYGQPLTQMIAPMTPSGMLGQAQQSSAEYADKFNPESQYMSDVMGGNIQNQMSAQLAAAQAKAGMGAGLMSMAGNIAGSYLGNQGLFNKSSAPTTPQPTSASYMPKIVYNV